MMKHFVNYQLKQWCGRKIPFKQIKELTEKLKADFFYIHLLKARVSMLTII